MTQINKRSAVIQEQVDVSMAHIQGIVLEIIADYCSFGEEGRIELLKNVPPVAHKDLIESEKVIGRIIQSFFSHACLSLNLDFELRSKSESQDVATEPANYVDFVETSEGMVNLGQVTKIVPINHKGLCEIFFANDDTIELPQREYQYLEKILEPFQLFEQNLGATKEEEDD
ncbi:MAG: hypothetical protein F6K21_05645 [Symploca sp. SIO2D2]|nr:hypothetical protein [Symploca sp. SIO2D2]